MCMESDFSCYGDIPRGKPCEPPGHVGLERQMHCERLVCGGMPGLLAAAFPALFLAFSSLRFSCVQAGQLEESS